MGFLNAIYAGFLNTFDFRGRATRAEFWYWMLFVFLIQLILFSAIYTSLSVRGAVGVLYVLIAFALVTVVPSISLAVRRSHDINLSGQWYLTYVGCVIVDTVLGLWMGTGAGPVTWILVIWYVVFLFRFSERGTEGENRFGPERSGTRLQARDPVAC